MLVSILWVFAEGKLAKENSYNEKRFEFHKVDPSNACQKSLENIFLLEGRLPENEISLASCCLFHEKEQQWSICLVKGIHQLNLWSFTIRPAELLFICSWMIRKLIKNLEISWSVTECKEKVFQIYDGQQSASHLFVEIIRLSAWADQRVAWKLSGILVGTPNYIRPFSSFRPSVASSN